MTNRLPPRTRRNAGAHKRCSANGFSLIEVLISVLVISIGMLGVAGLQTISLRQNYGSSLLAQATFQSQNIIERMRANMLGVNQGAYDAITGSETDPICFPNCTPAQLATYDAATWITTTKSELNDAGNGTVNGTVTRNVDGTFTASIFWQEPAMPGQVDSAGKLLAVVNNSHVVRFIP
ncbi:MAG: type IV pilus modification protein PilV [Thiohalomonadales bacterium]